MHVGVKEVANQAAVQPLTPFSDTVLNYTGYKVKWCVRFLTFSLLMCCSGVIFLSIFWLQHRHPL